MFPKADDRKEHKDSLNECADKGDQSFCVDDVDHTSI